MLRAARILAGVLAVLALLGPEAQAQCRPADSTSTFFVRELTRITTGTQPADQRMREIAKIPQVSANQVSLITNKTVCSKALSVYNSNTQLKSATTGQTISTPSTQIYVVQVGSVYAALDPTKHFGEYTMLVVMTKTYGLLANTGL